MSTNIAASLQSNWTAIHSTHHQAVHPANLAAIWSPFITTDSCTINSPNGSTVTSTKLATKQLTDEPTIDAAVWCTIDAAVESADQQPFWSAITNPVGPPKYTAEFSAILPAKQLAFAPTYNTTKHETYESAY